MYCHDKCFVTKIVEHIQHNSNKTNTCHYPIRPSHLLYVSIDGKVIIFDSIVAKKISQKELLVKFTTVFFYYSIIGTYSNIRNLISPMIDFLIGNDKVIFQNKI